MEEAVLVLHFDGYCIGPGGRGGEAGLVLIPLLRTVVYCVLIEKHS